MALVVILKDTHKTDPPFTNTAIFTLCLGTLDPLGQILEDMIRYLAMGDFGGQVVAVDCGFGLFQRHLPPTGGLTNDYQNHDSCRFLLL